MSSHSFSDVCCICKRLFMRGKQKLECSECSDSAHRTCLPKMTSGEFTNFKVRWKCHRCELGGGPQKESSSSEESSSDEDHDEEYRCPLELRDSDSTLLRFKSLSISGKRSQSSGQAQKTPHKFAHLNINGIKGKFPEVCAYLSIDKEILILALTESKLTPTDISYMIPGFHVEKIDRPHGEKGGGQLIYIHDSCSYQVKTFPLITSPPPGLVECNILSITKAGMPTTLLCVIYVPPRDVRNSFFPFFSEVCKVLTGQRGRMVIMGDFNVNWFEKSSYKRKLEEILEEFGLVQLVKKATRGDALLDHVYIKKEDGQVVCKVDRDASSSDHDLTWISFK